MIVNPCFQIGQVAESFTNPSTGHILDNWLISRSDAAAATISKDTDVPQDNVPSSLKIDITTADASMAASDRFILEHRIEGNLWNQIRGKEGRISFWVKSNKIGYYYVAIQNAGVDRELLLPYKINAADTWEKKVLTIPDVPTAGTWYTDERIGAYLSFCLAAGTNFEGTVTNEWETITPSTYNYCASNQVNLLDSTSNEFFLTDVRVSVGTVLPTSPPKTFLEDQLECQRYYFKTYNYDTAPGTASSTGLRAAAATGSGTKVDGAIAFPVPMRTSPTMTTYSTTSGTSGKVRDFTQSSDVTGIATAGEKSTYWGHADGTVSVGNDMRTHVVADARL